MDDFVNGPQNQALWDRYDAVIPGGGMYLTRSARFAGRDVMPGFIESADGCRVTDADGKTYLDFNCGNGPNMLGYCHPEVDEAAQGQAKKMDLASFFPTKMPEYAERLLQWGSGFDWAIFTKNGSDSTNLAMRIMRSARQKPIILLFNAAYHGFGTEFALGADKVFDEEKRNVIRLPWNDAEALLAAADEYGNQIAGMLVNPLDQNPTQVTTDISPDFAAAINTLRANTGAYVTVDDVRHGFRLHPGGSHKHIGIQPDLLCLGKAQANGYSTSTILGVEALRAGAENIQFTATYMFSSVAFAAGIATIDIYERDNVFDHITAMGQQLVDGITKVGLEAGHEDILMSGPPTMPNLLFKNDQKAKRARAFGGLSSRYGAIFHPTLNWFLCYAHKQADIEEAIDIARRAFEQTPTSVELL